MKKLIAVLIFSSFAKITLAQKDLLSFDEHNKFIYYQVVDAPGQSADSLHNTILHFLKISYPLLKLKTAAQSSTDIVGEGKFLSYSSILILKHENGEINYKLSFEFKDQRYRYWLTNFVYTPYKRDRYNNFVPQSGIDIPLETATAKLDKREVENHLNETGAFCKQFTDSLKLYFAKPVPVIKKEEPAKKIVTDKW
jgi:hypothetical protein